MVSWRWKVLKFPQKTAASGTVSDEKESWIERDDYAARVYVIFPHFNFRKIKCLEYVWDKDLSSSEVLEIYDRASPKLES